MELAERLRSAPDVRLFRLFCVLNASGYNLECNPAGMHPVRLAIRAALAGWESPVKQRLWTLVQQTHQFAFVYWTLNHGIDDPAALTGRSLTDAFAGSPELAAVFEALAPELDAINRAIFAESPWQGLWAEHRPAHEREAARHRPAGQLAVSAIEDYLRPKSPPKAAVVYVPNLLDSYSTGYAVDTGPVVYVVSGPSDDLNQHIVKHEYAHILVNPLVASQREALDATAHLFPKVADLSNQYLRPYALWAVFVQENLTEAVAIRAGHPDPERLARVMAHNRDTRGLSLVEPFMAPLERFERSGQSAENYLPGMIREVLLDLNP
ncbi:MAG: hypothetical protein ACYC53_09235 [Bacillota bacterium]